MFKLFMNQEEKMVVTQFANDYLKTKLHFSKSAYGQFNMRDIVNEAFTYSFNVNEPLLFLEFLDQIGENPFSKREILMMILDIRDDFGRLRNEMEAIAKYIATCHTEACRALFRKHRDTVFVDQ